MKIKWLGQGGYTLYDKETQIYIDPYLSDAVAKKGSFKRQREIPIRPEDIRADGIICTHNHLDHVDTEAIPKMDRSITFYAPADCKKILTEELGVKKYKTFDKGDSYSIGGFKINAVFADHTVPAVGVVVEYGGMRLYFTGDTYYNKKLENTSCDYLFVCINGRLGNMNVTEAVRLTNALAPKVAVPNHYDMFKGNSEDPSKFANALDNGFIMEFNREYEVTDRCLI